MTDEALRGLERRWRETGAVEDEAAFLAQRVRSGGLSRGALQVAAHLGHEAALAVVGHVAEPAELADPAQRAEGLVRWGQAVCVRFCIACAEAVLDEPRALGQDPPEVALLAIRVANDWLACPCEQHALTAGTLAHLDRHDGEYVAIRDYFWAREAPIAAAKASIAHRAARLALTLSAHELRIRPAGLLTRVGPVVARWALDHGHV